MYKKALHSFFLKVHPDFFAGNKQIQRANEVSIAQLNELLQWAKEFKGGALRGPPATSISLSFYQKQDDEKPQAKLSDTVISSKFELPGTFTPNEAHRGVAERAVNKFLRDLLRRAECIDATAENISNAEDATAERHEAKPLRKRHLQNKPEPKVRSLLDEAVDTLYDRWSVHMTPTVEELMDADQILFSRSLSPLHSAAAVQSLRAHLGEMMYDRWSGMPMLVSDAFAVGEVSGTISVPWDFTLPRFVAFIRHHETHIVASRLQVEQFAKDVEHLIAETCNRLDLSDILISVSHKEAFPCLQFLHRNTDFLAASNIRDVALEIGTRFSTRANGVVIVDYRMNQDSMHKWLKAIGPKMRRQQQLFSVSNQMLESTMWHLKEFRSMVTPKGIDAFQNDLTYGERLQWSKEMFRIGSNLAKWDWSDLVFSIGPVDINWTEGFVTLPHNFDGDSFVRYVEEIHQEAKVKTREELLKASAMERMQLDSARTKSLVQDSLEYAVKPSAEEQADSDRRKGELLAGQPHLEEYLVSHPTGRENLSVERPLHHQTTFQSDEEVKDQMEWDGFHNSPYVQQTPDSDLEDIRHAYHATNRMYREAAAKKVIAEMKEKYGGKTKKFAHMKMGDMLGLNDPRTSVKGFPIMVKGTEQGDKTYSTTAY